MTRETSADFRELVDFVFGYNLAKFKEDRAYIEILSREHKKYFAYLTEIAEISFLSAQKAIAPILAAKQLSFLTESCSDIGNALFVGTHGAYKPARAMLRSSIETFLKGFVIDEVTNIDEEKSVYRLFERVQDLPFFKASPHQEIITTIHSEYKLLCKDVHTASELTMASITALKYFPAFSYERASAVSDTMIKLTSCFLTLICMKYNAYFHQMHHRSKENIISNIPKEFRPHIQGIR